MKLLSLLKSLVMKRTRTEGEWRSIVIMQRKAHRFTEEELRTAAELAWGRKFDGNEDPMYFVSANHHALTVVKAGSHMIRVMSVPNRYADDDEYALSQLLEPEQRKAWSEHHACVFLELFNDVKSSSMSDRDLCITGETGSTISRSKLRCGVRADQKHHVAERWHCRGRSAAVHQQATAMKR